MPLVHGIVSYAKLELGSRVIHMFGEIHFSPHDKRYIYLTPDLEKKNPCEESMKEVCARNVELSVYLLPYLRKREVGLYLESPYLTSRDNYVKTSKKLLDLYKHDVKGWEKRNNLDHVEYYAYSQQLENTYFLDLRYIDRQPCHLFVDAGMDGRDIAKIRNAIHDNLENIPLILEWFLDGVPPPPNRRFLPHNKLLHEGKHIIYHLYMKLTPEIRNKIKLYYRDLLTEYTEVCEVILSKLDNGEFVEQKILCQHQGTALATLEMDIYTLVVILQSDNPINILLCGAMHIRSYLRFLAQYLRLYPTIYEDKVFLTNLHDPESFKGDYFHPDLLAVKQEVNIPEIM